ncbi:hypothetical protein Sru01_12430 [Sphaerisporangium rufum]|uniref:DUF3800 domain-containing protein n=1 Tax=Sphaerisporangium rufum TaxID=1381558 RepID=A0A919R0P7_9ACTN|nr:hypothetical protein Sru01_12430 [Sphaerisporangium rufum]
MKHAFVDESARGGYLICAVAIAPADLPASRRALRKLCKPGQQRIHMASESDSRRREILSMIDGIEVAAHVYQAELAKSAQRVVRDDCFRAAVPSLIAMGVSRLIIESCNQDRQDRLVIHEALSKADAHDLLVYGHDRPALEPLLWVPDALAWAYGKGGDWRRRTRGAIQGVIKV